MTTRKRTKKQTSIKKGNSAIIFFTAFVVIAFLTVVLLEYIDFNKGKESFIFTKIIPLETFAAKTETFNTQFLAVLKKNKIEYNYFQAKTNDRKYRFEVTVKSSLYKGLIKQLNRVARELKGEVKLAQVEGMPQKSINLYHVYIDKKISHVILITKHRKAVVAEVKKPEAEPEAEQPPVEKPTPAPVTATGGRPRIAFIIDDIGAYDIGALALKKLNIPITASILPDSPHARAQAKWVQNYGLETMLHIPMQPKNGNGATYNKNETITLKSKDGDIRRLIRRAKKIVPHARGLNNHQGSLATSNRPLMVRTLKIIKEEGLFFVDSRTIGNSAAYDVAVQMGIRSTYKDVFLDHVSTYDHSRAQIRRLVEVALSKGQAVAIGHPHQSTLNAIRDSISYIRSKNIEIVYVSQLLK